jgi:hypothetical protein
MDGSPVKFLEITGGMQAIDVLIKKLTSLLKTVRPILALAAKARF